MGATANCLGSDPLSCTKIHLNVQYVMKNIKHFVIWWLDKNYRSLAQLARYLLPRLLSIAIVLSSLALATIAFGFLIIAGAHAKGSYIEGDYLFLAKLAIVPTAVLLCTYVRLQWEQWQAEQDQTIYDLRRQYSNQK